jgi:hypothetical protein
MQITIKQRDGIKRTHRKENGLHRGYKVLAIDNNRKVHHAVDCRLYWPAERVYCCIWYSNGEIYGSGSGYAGGYGYCKQSAAIADALIACGIDYDTHLSGVGLEKAREVLKAIGQYLYPDAQIEVVEFYG